MNQQVVFIPAFVLGKTYIVAQEDSGAVAARDSSAATCVDPASSGEGLKVAHSLPDAGDVGSSGTTEGTANHAERWIGLFIVRR